MMRALLLCLLLVPVAGIGAPAPADADGKATRAWIDLQRSNRAAYGKARPMPGEVADKVYRRYLDSHGRPIPEKFTRESSASGGSGSR